MDVTLHVAPDADHVLKHQPQTMDELRANQIEVQANYNAEDRVLDANAVRAITDWLTTRTR